MSKGILKRMPPVADGAVVPIPAEQPLKSRQKVQVLGREIDRLTMAETVSILRDYLQSTESHLVLTADASSVYMSTIDPNVAEVFRSASIVTPDGSGVVWASKTLGKPITERVSGVDLVAQLFKLSSEGGYRIFCLGAAPGVAEDAANELCRRYPGAVLAGTADGYFKSEDEPRIVEMISDSKPDVLLVAMGLPRQEQFILRNMAKIGAKVSMGIGGSFDVFSGRVRRAPVFMQRLHIEWLWRLCQDPKKFKRILMLPKFVLAVRKQAKHENLH